MSTQQDEQLSTLKKYVLYGGLSRAYILTYLLTPYFYDSLRNSSPFTEDIKSSLLFS
jgi:hypothetical protein